MRLMGRKVLSERETGFGLLFEVDHDCRVSCTGNKLLRLEDGGATGVSVVAERAELGQRGTGAAATRVVMKRKAETSTANMIERRSVCAAVRPRLGQENSVFRCS
jgi:hypothetical protein